MLTFIPAAILLLTRQMPDWTLSPAYAPGKAQLWAVNVGITLDGADHQANFKFSEVIKAADAGKPITAVLSQTDLTLDNGQTVPDESWDVKLDPRGPVLSVDGDDGYRRMWSPFLLAYPDKPVPVGGSWTYKVKPTDKDARAQTFTYSSAAVDHVGGEDLLKVTSKVEEDGTDSPTVANGTYWIAKGGHVAKFEVKISNWLVPMMGNQQISATIKAEYIPPKTHS